MRELVWSISQKRKVEGQFGPYLSVATALAFKKVLGTSKAYFFISISQRKQGDKTLEIERSREGREKMSHFGRTGPPDISDTYSLLVLNITFRTTADDLFPLFDKYGKVVDIFIPRDRRTGESRGFAFVRYKYADEAQKAVDRLDGRVVDGREMAVQFAKYGPNAERIHQGRIIEKVSAVKGSSRSRSPRRRYRDDYHREREYRRSRSRSVDRNERDRSRRRERDYRYRSRSRSLSPDYDRSRGRGRDKKHHRRSPSYDSASPARRSPSPLRKESPRKSLSPKKGSPERLNPSERSPTPRSRSPPDRAMDSRSPSPRVDEE
ncbi:serine/arginine-rich splicing factor SC35-like isoform X2 [Lycium ferocissimum]|uniref:serine/arginine-rich splicing factor SC35-like isoform X2 n=1 Tax=Lycium ferocissimum TaxID=112874 RepID=UPI002815750A|nr:serine/arginine-rich splicing factor SC35-like isoform X2 [Lycium ferocissimum]